MTLIDEHHIDWGLVCRFFFFKCFAETRIWHSLVFLALFVSTNIFIFLTLNFIWVARYLPVLPEPPSSCWVRHFSLSAPSTRTNKHSPSLFWFVSSRPNLFCNYIQKQLISISRKSSLNFTAFLLLTKLLQHLTARI